MAGGWETLGDAARAVAASARQWRAVRQVLTAHRGSLDSVAAGLYPGTPRVGRTNLLTRPEWLPAEPLDIGAVTLRWCGQAPPPVADGSGPASRHVRPAAPRGGRYPTYAAAIADLDPPALFEDRPCYRILNADLTGAGAPARGGGVPGSPLPGGGAGGSPAGGGGASMTFSITRYFTAVSLGHAVAHELAAAWRDSPAAVSLDRLQLRAATGDPCALERRPAICAVTTLTLRRERGGGASFVLHWRDPARVNHAGGLYQVMPAGIFQPVTAGPAAERADLDVWRCMVREFSEEFLGAAEEYETAGGTFDYRTWPLYQRLTGARAAGRLGVWCLGVGVDPVTLATDILTVAVIDAEVADGVFSQMVAANAEGRVVTEAGSAWIPFTRETVARFTGGGEPMQAAGAALLRLAWLHRRHLLG